MRVGSRFKVLILIRAADALILKRMYETAIGKKPDIGSFSDFCGEFVQCTIASAIADFCAIKPAARDVRPQGLPVPNPNIDRRTKLDLKSIDRARELLSSGLTQQIVATRFGVSPMSVSRVQNENANGR
ncbi:MAG: helix-turn-helix domain-containing protein [Candidatus Acidiferrales bacterium]